LGYQSGRIRVGGGIVRHASSVNCAPLFERTKTRDRNKQYLRGLLDQQPDRRNAENLAEIIAGAAPRSLQRFLTKSPWDDEPVNHRLQEHVNNG